METATATVTEMKTVPNDHADDRRLGTGNIRKLYFKYSLLTLLGYLIFTSQTIVDGMIVGNGIGDFGLAAVTVVSPVFVLSRALGLLIGSGAGALVAVKLGEKNVKEARSLIGQSLWFGLIVSVLIMGVGLYYLEPLMIFFGGSGEVLTYAMEYGRILLYGFPFAVLAAMLTIFATLDERPGLSSRSWGIAAVVAIILEPIMVYKLGMGLQGAAWAANILQGLPVYIIFYFLFGKTQLRPKLDDIKLSFREMGSVLLTGMPQFMVQASMIIGIIMLNNMLMSYGSDAHVASFGIQNGYITNYLFLISHALVLGVQPIISYNYGAKLFGRVREVMKIALLFTGVGIVFLTGMLLVYTTPIVSMFISDDPALSSMTGFFDISVETTRIFNFIYPLTAINLLVIGYLQSIERNGWAFFTSIAKSLLFFVPVVLIASNQFGVYGVWYAMPIAEIIGFILSVAVIFSEFKRLKRLEMETNA
ncbi:MATE family efflux transporter [Siminovitchia terrae]|uniref:Multidrug export protein MepA n=1 Tax=Siminovitchia terrae TaxID=1914933 RepID=A0ABQ4KS19_SIMTE|nr:MATE family efflux transporter [Siminovitchia terrae]GIN94790.1 MATE family efflux transporter [Siminovitchia terrae]